MTYNELTGEVATLGFENEVENRPALLYSANRALRTLAALSPTYGRLTIIQRVFKPCSYIERIDYYPGKEITVPLEGAVFSLKFSGAGDLTLKERHRVTPMFIDTPYTEIRRFLPDHKGELVLSGDITFTLKDIACYPYVCGTAESDIPMVTPYRSYQISRKAKDFYSFVSLPTDENGNPVVGTKFEDDTLLVPSDYEGELHLSYRRLPREILSDAPNAEIEIAPALEHLLPLLTAAYLWLDDDSAKAQFYMQMYMEGIRDVRMSRSSRAETEIKDTHNWA